ncbi:Williams-Beuren syndrome chromosome region 16 protein, putative [Brugia malayi]|uniref:Williams-Beuren syndrome chromosome region 16 protein, putative n=1 Tax=Brugia malayi TaxID=6279 RepID=A0A4E9F6B1_BRUMA|nr:Williams-Beuren syndrome chromosome region 16 protein, putative [Brugia malayi]VIO92315.1 Williams-Beuren syndrome chromosome region 16 protein, putative [Brugia malayi]
MKSVAVQEAITVARLKAKKSNLVYGCGFGKTGSLFTKVLRETGQNGFKKPRQILYFNSPGRRHFLVASKKAVYAFGDNAHGQCGQDPENVPFVRLENKPFQKIMIPSDSKIAEIHCTLDTSFIILDSGEVFSFGLGTDGQLGRGICNYDWRCLPIEGDLKGMKVAALKGSTDTLMAVTESGELFMWGQNEYEQMHPFVKDIQSGFPCEIRLSMEKIIAADSTATSCIALTAVRMIRVK